MLEFQDLQLLVPGAWTSFPVGRRRGGRDRGFFVDLHCIPSLILDANECGIARVIEF